MNDYMQYVGVDFTPYLIHFGVSKRDGAKVGSGRYPLGSGERPYRNHGSSTSEALKSIKAQGHYMKNIDKLGRDENHNVLFITGLSGSGKSTASEKFRNANRIHLDFYTEDGDPEETKANQDPEFNNFLRGKHIPFEKVPKLDFNSSEKWQIVDQIGDALIDFSKQQYKKQKLVVAEGVQLADQTLYPDKSFFDDKPLIVTTTPMLRSVLRGMKRDDISPFDIACVAQRIKMNRNWNKGLKELMGR
jgi:dephospho-CoA kinase